ncbi:MAG: MerR family transcriptional regulator [Rhodopirellula sp.]|nr:MerR family transcriptional regulator [Rhodopirellula sp.]
MSELFTTSQVAKLLAIKSYQLTYALSLGIVPEPQRLSGRRLFSQQDIERLRQHFSSKGESDD